jgi:hypothetical protein
VSNVNPASWSATRPESARTLSDARLQAHYAAQFGAALGISYLPGRPDDSHTNLGWNAALGSLGSRAVPTEHGAVAIELRVRDLTLLVTRDGDLQDEVGLGGSTIAATLHRLRSILGALGLNPERYSLERHYSLPPHPVANGARFEADDAAALGELARWFGNGALALDRATRGLPDASEIRAWPHHFDIGSLVTYAGGSSTGAGMEPGDRYYEEPYFYVNAHPQPRPDLATGALAGSGQWHYEDWIGAVLPGSRITGDAATQERQVGAFLDSALTACRELAGA